MVLGNHYLRRAWNEHWEYPSSSTLVSIDQEYPALAPFFFSWEKNFRPRGLVQFSRFYYWLAPVFFAAYLAFLWLGPKWMKNRKPYDLRTPLKCWNLFLAAFSFCGAVRVVPQAILLWSKLGFVTTLCVPPVWGFGAGACGFWSIMFAYSKFIELIDTVFIVLRKRQLTFLHCYHHASVLLYTWDGMVTEQPAGMYFCAMNYSVHTLMYFYYYLAAEYKRPLNWGVIVTVLQISQMIGGIIVTVVSAYLSYTYPFLPYTTPETAFRPLDVPGCYLTRYNILIGVGIYGTYFLLFLNFFWNRHVSKAPSQKLDATKQLGEGHVKSH